MTGADFIGAVAAEYLRKRLLEDEGEGTARYIINLSAEQTAAVARAVLQDEWLASQVEMRLPINFLRDRGLPDSILTEHRATYLRNINCDRSALLLANTGDDEAQSLKELMPIGGKELRDLSDLWVRVASDGLAMSEEHLAWWVASLRGLHRLHDYSIEQVAEYVLETRRAIEQDGFWIVRALGLSLPALRVPRDSALFESIKPNLRHQPSQWKRVYDDAHKRRAIYLRKQTSAQTVLSKLDLDRAFTKVQDNIPTEHHEAIRAFIASPPTWNDAAAILARCEWEQIRPLFDGLKRDRYHLGKETSKFYDERDRELVTASEREYLARLAASPRLSEAQEEDRLFYEEHRNELKEDAKLKSHWDRFIFGAEHESEDFIAGLARCMENLFVQQGRGGSRTLRIRSDRRSKHDLRSLNIEAGLYFARRYKGLPALLGNKVAWDVDKLFDFEELVSEWRENNTSLNVSVAKTALQLKFTLQLDVETPQGGPDTYTAQLVWKFDPKSVASGFVGDWDRLAKHHLTVSTSTRRQAGGKGNAQTIDLGDVRTLQPVYGQVLGSLVAPYQRDIDVLVQWETHLRSVERDGLVEPTTAATLRRLFSDFQSTYASAIQGFAQDGLACEHLETQLKRYGALLEACCRDARGDKNRHLLLRPLLNIGTVQVDGGSRAAIVAPWHPLRLAAMSRKARMVADFIRTLLSREQVEFGDPRLYFRDLELELAHPFYPEVVLGWNGDKAEVLSLTDTVGDYSLHEPPTVTSGSGDDTNENPTHASATVLDLVQRYLALYPHKYGNLSVVLYNTDSARLPQAVVSRIAAVYDDGDDIRCQVILRHSDGKRLQALYERIVETSDDDPDSFSTSEAQRDFMARLRIAILADQAPPPTPQDGCFADIAFSQDVIARHSRLEWYEETARPAALEELVPPRWSRRRPAAKDDMKSVVYLCCPVQSEAGWNYLTALTTFVRGDWNGDTNRRLLPARQLDFQDPRMKAIFDDTHKLATWVVNYDELLDRRQLLNQGVRVIRYKQATTQGRNIVISSDAPLDLLRQMVGARLRSLDLGITESEYQELVDRFIDDANGISGDIVLRASKHGNYASELMGVVLSRFLIEHELGRNRFYGWYFLDDYAAWLGQREEQIADILTLSPEMSPDGRLRLAIIISEAKYIDASAVAAKRKESQKQLRDTVARVNEALFGDPERIDRDLWLARLSDLILDGVQFPANAKLNLADWRRAFREGMCEVYVRGYSHVFISGPTDDPDISSFTSVPTLDNAYQEVFDRSRVRRLVQSYLRREDPLPVRQEMADQPIWGDRDYRYPVGRIPSAPVGGQFEGVNPPDDESTGGDSEGGTPLSPHPPQSPSGSRSTTGEPTEHDEREDNTMQTRSNGEDGTEEADGNWAYSGIGALLDRVGRRDTHETNDLAWLRDTEGRMKSALQQFQMRAKLLTSSLTPNAALLKFAGSDDLTVELVNKRRSQFLTTYGLNIISVQPEAGVVALSVERPKRQIVQLQDLWQQWSPDCTDGNQELLIATRESDGNLLFLAPGSGHAPHTLIAGSTGSGKSVLIQNIILAIAATNHPSQARLVIIDPKQGVDYFQFDSLPHLDGGIIDQVDTALDRLQILVQEMDARYNKFKVARAPNLRVYNQKVPQAERLPVIWLIHDEFAEWMMIDEYKQEVTSMVSRLGVKARAAGIHLIFAAQRPDANVMPMQLRANLGNRLILRVDSEGTSELALGEKGAERLLGRGHLLAKLEGEPLQFAQVPFAEEAFMDRLIALIR